MVVQLRRRAARRWLQAPVAAWCAVAAGLVVSCARPEQRLLSAAVSSGLSAIEVNGPEGPWAPDPSGTLAPTGRWVQVGEVVAFLYVDSSEGLSAQWRTEPVGAAGSVQIRRLVGLPAGARILDGEAARALGLPEAPEWLAPYGPQPAPGTLYGTWRSEPAFARRLHIDYPDDLRVLIGTIDAAGQIAYAEAVWARVLACDALRCTAALLNRPYQVPLEVGARLAFDLNGVAADRLPAAAADGEAPHEAVVHHAATAAAFAGALQDVASWVPDTSLPPEQRLPPLGHWVAVGGELAFVFLGPRGAMAWVPDRPEASQFQPMPWRPVGLIVLPPDMLSQGQLPPAPQIPYPQPEPGTWGWWRFDPRTAWLFERPTPDPDVVWVRVVAGAGEGKADTGLLRIHGCQPLVAGASAAAVEPRCWGLLEAEAAGLPVSAPLQFRYLQPLPGEAVLPVAWLDGAPFPGVESAVSTEP